MSTEVLSLPRIARRLPLVLVALVGLIPLAIFLVNPSQYLLEHHGFRQTQTAIASYWLMHGGDFFRYLVPVFGAPWTLPMEFPLFQGLVALVCKLTGLPLDFTGRLLSLVFFYGTCVPMLLCLRKYGWPAVVMAVALFLTAPINLFFSRTFLIETFATMLALSALCSYILFLRSGKSSHLWVFVLLGTLAGLQKITTFLPVVAVVGLDSVRTQLRPILYLRWRDADLRAAVAVILSMVLPVIWTLYSDHVKEEGALSASFTAAALQDWNFGTLAQRLDLSAWSYIFGVRVLLMGGLVIGLPLIAYAVSKKQFSFNREAGLFLCSGLLGPVVFFNLHLVHDYYQVGILVFLACAVAIVIAPCLQAAWDASRVTFVGLFLVIVVTNLASFYRYYGVQLMWQLSPDPIAHKVANYLKANEAEGDVTVVFGQDWSSVIPYYSERYAIMVPKWAPAATRAAVVRNAGALAGGKRIGAIVYCDDGSVPPGQVTSERAQLFSQLQGSIDRISSCQIKLRGS